MMAALGLFSCMSGMRARAGALSRRVREATQGVAAVGALPVEFQSKLGIVWEKFHQKRKSPKNWLRASRRRQTHRQSVEEKEEEDWQKKDQMEVQWAEDEKLEEILQRRTVETSYLQAGSHTKGTGVSGASTHVSRRK